MHVIFFHIWANAWLLIPVQNFLPIGPQTTKIMDGGGRGRHRPPNLNMSKKPNPIRIKVGKDRFPVSPDVYSLFDTLFVGFHGLMKKWQQDIF